MNFVNVINSETIRDLFSELAMKYDCSLILHKSISLCIVLFEFLVCLLESQKKLVASKSQATSVMLS